MSGDTDLRKSRLEKSATMAALHSTTGSPQLARSRESGQVSRRKTSLVSESCAAIGSNEPKLARKLTQSDDPSAAAAAAKTGGDKIAPLGAPTGLSTLDECTYSTRVPVSCTQSTN